MFAYLAIHYFFLWQFDHNAAQYFWENPYAKDNHVDMWVLGELLFGRRYISAIDVYNCCMVILICVPAVPCALFIRFIAGMI